MTDSAQQALRTTIEKYSNTTRFAFACNSSEKIIEPIQSRCVVIRFAKIPDENISKKLIEICKKENLDYTKEGIDAIVFVANNDLRFAINNLQAVADGFNSKITSENVFKICDEPHPIHIENMFKHCLEYDFDKAFIIIANLRSLGYSSEDIIAIVFRICKTYPMPEFLKLEFIKEIGSTQLRISKGLNSIIQLSGLVSRLCKIQKSMLS
ncbi:hypothetical protein SSS_10670 [Sarcoptes scabiei]|nr:hypothetical protein SSS_10670 [Sarcoptes scabiei]